MNLLNRTLPLLLATLLVAPMASAFDWPITLPDFLKPATIPEQPSAPAQPAVAPIQPAVAPIQPAVAPTQPAVAPAPDDEDQDRGQVRIVRGAASKGPIAGATVNIFLASETGMPASNAPVATTTTDVSGNFTVALPADNEMYLVQTSGGSFIDESDQRPLASRRRITLGSNEQFESIIFGGQTEVAVTPYTDAMVVRARLGSSLGGFSTLMQAVIDLSTEGFGFSLFTTLPVDPVTPPAGASSSALQYALLLGTAANLANVSAIQMGLAAPTYEVIRDVIRDMSDGVTDGAEFGEPIINATTGQMLPVLDFDQQLVRFRNNNYRHYSAVELPEWNSAQDDLSVQFPTNMILTRESDAGLSFGVDAIDHLARIKLSANGVALLTDEEGTGMLASGTSGNAVWDSFGNSFRLDFSAIGGKVQGASTFFVTNEQNLQDSTQELIYIDRVELELIGDVTANPRQAQARLFFREEITNLTTNVTTFEQFEESTVVTIYDADDTIAFPGFEFMPALPALTDESINREIGVDLMIFDDDGTGIAVYKNDPFSWMLSADNSLRVDFSSGEFANYFILTLDDDGVSNDYVAVDYFDGSRMVHTGNVVFSKDLNLSWIPSQVPGKYQTDDVVRLDDGTLKEETVIYHLYPDGTGAVEFDSINTANGLALTSFSQFRLCWDLTSDGLLRRKRSFIPFDSTGRGEFPTPEYCANLANDNTAWTRDHDLFDTTAEGGTKTVVQYFENTCGRIMMPTSGCDDLQRIDSFPALYHITPITSVPPIPENDGAATTFDSPVSIDVLGNDIPGDFAINPGSLQVVQVPTRFDETEFLALGLDGTAVVSAGQILYTPDIGNTMNRRVTFAYRVSDTSGNESVAGRVFVDVGPQIPPPVFSASPSSLADVHNVGVSPCSDPIDTVSISSSSGGDFVITNVSILGAINGFIEATEQTPGTQSSSQLIDVAFNCASADAAIRNGSIDVSTTDIASGSTATVSIPVTHEVDAGPTVSVSPASVSDIHNVGVSPCPDPIGPVTVSSSDGTNFRIDDISVTGEIFGFVTATAAAVAASAPVQDVNLSFNCAAATVVTRTGNITINTTNTATGITSSATVAVSHRVL